jgi:tetratricopeptide (TPR) repeat protein
LKGLRERLSRLSNADEPEIALKKEAARKAIDAADFKSADALLAEAEDADLHAGQRRILAACETMAERGALARAQAQYETAAGHYERAAETAAAFDRQAALGWWLSQADILDDHGRLFPGPSLHRAVTILRDKCLPLTPRATSGADWAATQNNLGNALRTLGERAGGEDGLAALNDAVTAYRGALEVYTRKDMPVGWATTQNNLGIALRTLGELVGGAKGLSALNEAVAAYRAALEVHTRKDMPANWALIQNNLGVALQTFGERAGGEEGLSALNEAVAAYRLALVVHTRKDMPIQWATTQNNLGNALETLGERAGGRKGFRP